MSLDPASGRSPGDIGGNGTRRQTRTAVLPLAALPPAPLDMNVQDIW